MRVAPGTNSLAWKAAYAALTTISQNVMDISVPRQAGSRHALPRAERLGVEGRGGAGAERIGCAGGGDSLGTLIFNKCRGGGGVSES